MPDPSNLEPRGIERRFENLELATGQTPPLSTGALAPVTMLPILASGAIGTVQVTVAHGLSYIPKIIGLVMTSAGIIFQSASPDATNVYLTADAAARTANLTLSR